MSGKFAGNMDVYFLLKKLDNHIQKYLPVLYKKMDIQEYSLMNLWVCDFLYDNRNGAIYQKDVEAEFSINRATASKMLLLMEEKQLICRKSSEEDGRLKKLELLPRGLWLHGLCCRLREEMEEKLTAGLSLEETALFKELCRKILSSMEG